MGSIRRALLIFDRLAVLWFCALGVYCSTATEPSKILRGILGGLFICLTGWAYFEVSQRFDKWYWGEDDDGID